MIVEVEVYLVGNAPLGEDSGWDVNDRSSFVLSCFFLARKGLALERTSFAFF